MNKSNLRRLGKLIARKLIAQRAPGFRPDLLAGRAALAADIAANAQDGHVAVVECGVDCDGYRWDNDVSILPASAIAVGRHLDARFADAEGPMGHQLTTPSRAAKLRREVRDLAMEAYEDGRPHLLRA